MGRRLVAICPASALCAAQAHTQQKPCQPAAVKLVKPNTNMCTMKCASQPSSSSENHSLPDIPACRSSCNHLVSKARCALSSVHLLLAAQLSVAPAVFSSLDGQSTQRWCQHGVNHMPHKLQEHITHKHRRQQQSRLLYQVSGAYCQGDCGRQP
jgi:hypothetical protein